MERVFPIYTRADLLPVLEGLLITVAAFAQIIWAVFIQKGRRGLALSWGILWAAAAHFPNSGLAVPTNSLFLEHWLYVPTTGLFLGIAESLHGVWTSITTYLRSSKPRLTKYLGFATLIVFLGLAGKLGTMTFEQNTVWQNPITFYKHLFSLNEGSARAHNNLALAYAERGDLTQALDEFQKAIHITDTYAETQHNYALTLLNLPDQASHINEAIEHLNRSLEIDPNFYRSLDALAAIYEHLGDHSRAEDYRRRAAIAKARFGAP
jgi:tetratricopeptide (TPR) repeat protein